MIITPHDDDEPRCPPLQNALPNRRGSPRLSYQAEVALCIPSPPSLLVVVLARLAHFMLTLPSDRGDFHAEQEASKLAGVVFSILTEYSTPYVCRHTA